jgi:membrane protease YdiL (CAAX protease family)
VLAGVVIALGLAAEMVGWRRVAAHRADVWRLMPVVLGAMGVVAAVVAPWAPAEVGTAAALIVGAASGLVLFVGTRIFVWGASRWEPFRRQTIEKYQEAAEVPLSRSLVLSLLVMVPAEEVFWRGLTQATLADSSLGVAGAAVGAGGLYLLANLPSRSLPIVAGAVVGGALWVSLWWWSEGVLAPLASHILWTGAMLVLPPGAGRGKERA